MKQGQAQSNEWFCICDFGLPAPTLQHQHSTPPTQAVKRRRRHPSNLPFGHISLLGKMCAHRHDSGMNAAAESPAVGSLWD